MKQTRDTQDFGTTLALVLRTPAVIAVARGLAAYLARTGTTVRIKKDGEVVLKNVRGDDAAKIVAALNTKKPRKPDGTGHP